MPMYLVNKNPPLVSYYIAFIAYFFGWKEVALHIAFLIPAVGLSLGTYYLARFFSSRPHIAALIAIFTPVFLVSSTNIMTDTMMVAFYIWAVVIWLKGIEADKSLYFFFAGILITLSALTKYFGVTLVPLLFVYSLFQRRKLGKWALFLLIPVFLLAGYQWLTHLMYGHGLISSAASFTIKPKIVGNTKIIDKIFVAFAFMGGCIVTVVFFVPLLWPRRLLVAWGGLLFICFIFLLWMENKGVLFPYQANGVRWSFIIQFSIFIISGVHILVLASTDLWRNRDPISLLIFLWVTGTFLFILIFNWAITARIVLPIVPAVGILVMRRYDLQVKLLKSIPSQNAFWPLMLSAIIALSVTWADASWGNSQKDMAHMIHRKFDGYPHTQWFQGHWGFQYYMESIGAKALDYNKSILQPGDIVIVPLNNCFIEKPPEDRFHLVGKITLRPCRWLATMSKEAGAGFYIHLWGPLPFAIGTIAPEVCLLYLAGNFDKPNDAIRQFGNKLKEGHF